VKVEMPMSVTDMVSCPSLSLLLTPVMQLDNNVPFQTSRLLKARGGKKDSQTQKKGDEEKRRKRPTLPRNSPALKEKKKKNAATTKKEAQEVRAPLTSSHLTRHAHPIPPPLLLFPLPYLNTRERERGGGRETRS
jgi:hypothetical protein